MGRLRRKVSSLVVVGVMSGLALLVLVPANAAQVTPVQVSGNPSCTSIGSSAAFSTKFEPISANLSVSRTVNGVTINMTIDGTGRFMSFSVTNGHADDVIVKGGPNANRYAYGEGGTTADSGLQAPSRGSSSFAISHVEFCYDVFVAPPTFSISGIKFHDHDADGTQDVGDEGLNGWTISAGSQSTTTGSDGSYSISGLLAGTYNVCETPQEGWLASSPTTGCQEVTVGPDATNANFGNYQNGAISGSKTDGEVGLGGWTIFIDDNGNGELDDGEQSTTTAFEGEGVGSYTLSGLRPGSYDVCEVLQSGYGFTDPDDGCHEGVTVSSGQTMSNVNFSNHQVFGISGSKYNDQNANGDNDEGEPKVSGWAIYLFDSADALVDSTVTDTNGDYSFDDVLEGTYIVCEEADGPGEENWQQSGPLNDTCAALPAGEVSLAAGGHPVIVNGTGSSTGNDFFNFNGVELICGEPVTTPEEGDTIGTFTRFGESGSAECQEPKSALLSADQESDVITFIPLGSSTAFYTGVLTFVKSTADPDVLLLEYDPFDNNEFVEVPDCEVVEGQPQFPDGDPNTWCVADATATYLGGDQWQIDWNVLGIGDPKFR